MTDELTPIQLGLTPTGSENRYDPRKEYRFNTDGRYNLCHFLNIPADTLWNMRDRTIWLTPRFIEDLLIFHAFQVKNRKAVIVSMQIDAAGTSRVLSATDDTDLINKLIGSTAAEVYVNPQLFLPTH